jgi:hypothetical protein
MAKPKKATAQFAICIKSDDPDLLTPRRIYQVLPDESADRSNYIRVIDNEGEDYLYPTKYFIFVDFPLAAERALLRASL